MLNASFYNLLNKKYDKMFVKILINGTLLDLRNVLDKKDILIYYFSLNYTKVIFQKKRKMMFLFLKIFIKK